MAAPKRAKSKSGAPARKRAGASPHLADALAEAAWAEADRALAQAIADLAALQDARSAKARAEAVMLLSQSLQRAARRRGLASFGAPGTVEAYDPVRHAYAGTRTPKRVRILTPGVMRGADVVVKALAGPVRAPAQKRARS